MQTFKSQLLDAIHREAIEHFPDADNRQAVTYYCRNCGYMGKIINNELEHACSTEL